MPLAMIESDTPLLSVEIVFRMSTARFIDADLDKLTRPVLETICDATHDQASIEAGDVSGVLVGLDDSRVVR